MQRNRFALAGIFAVAAVLLAAFYFIQPFEAEPVASNNNLDKSNPVIKEAQASHAPGPNPQHCYVGLVNVGNDTMSLPYGSTGSSTSWAWQFDPPLQNLEGGGSAYWYVSDSSPPGITTTYNPASAWGYTNVWSFSVAPNLAPGTYSFSVWVDAYYDLGNYSDSCNNVYVVIDAPAAPPGSVNLTYKPGSMPLEGPIDATAGDGVYLAWESSDIVSGSCSMYQDGNYLGNVADRNRSRPGAYFGSIASSPSTQYYSIQCQGLDGNYVSDDVQFNVSAPTPPPTVNFWADPGTVYTDQQATLHWTVEGAYSNYCNAGTGWGGVKGSDAGVEYIENVGPYPWAGTAVYTLQCMGPGGWSDIETVYVTVLNRPDFALSCSPVNLTVSPGSSTSVNLSYTPYYGFSSSVYANTPYGVPGASYSYSPSVYLNNTVTVYIPAYASPGTYTTTFSATGGGLTRDCDVDITVNSPASVSLSASSTSIDSGQSTTLYWTPYNTYSGFNCTAGDSWYGSKGSNPGQTYSETISFGSAGTYTHSIYCSGPGGNSSTASIVITVKDFSLSCSPTSVGMTAGGSGSFNVIGNQVLGFSSNVTLSHTMSYGSWGAPNSANPPTLSYNSNHTPGSATPVTINSSGSTIPGNYHITITGVSGALSRSCYVTINLYAPVSVSLSLTSPTISVGQGTTINWTPTSTYSGTNCTASGSWSGAKGSNSGQSYSEVINPIYTAGYYTYTLTCSGSSGTASGSVTLTVQDYTVACSPTSATINPGSSTTINFSSTPLYGYSNNINISTSIDYAPVTPTISYSPTYQSPGGTTPVNVYAPSNVTPGVYSLGLHTSLNGLGRTCYATITVNSPVTVDLNASVNPIMVGNSQTLTWQTSGTYSGSSCTASSTDGRWSGAKTSTPGYWSQTLSAYGSVGTFTYSITCSGPGGSASDSVTVTVQDFTIACSPASLTVNPGSSTSFNVSSTAYNGFSNTIGLYGTVSSASVPPTLSYSSSNTPGGTNAVTVNTTGSTTPGTYTITFSGTASTVTRTCSVTLTVNAPVSVSISVSPSTIYVGQSSTIFWTPTNATPGYNCTASGSWSGSKDSSTRTHTESTGVMGSAGYYTYSIYCTGASGTSATVSAVLTVQDYYVSCSTAFASINPGGSTSVNLTSGGYYGYNSTISFSHGYSPTPSVAPTVSYSPSSSQSTGGTTTATISAPSNVSSGTYTLTFYGTSNGITRTCNLSLTINPPVTVSLSVSPSTITAGNAATLSWTTSGTYSGTNCTASGSWSGSKTSTAGTYSESTGAMYSYGTYTYSITCSGAGGSGSASTTLTVQDYSISCAPSTLTVNAGSSTSFNITSTAYNGFSGSLTMSGTVSAAAVPPTLSYNASHTIGGTTPVTINTTSGTTAGTYTINFSAAAATGNRYCSVTLTVNGPVSVSLSVSPSTIVVGQAATLSWTTTNTYSGTSCTASGSWSGAKTSTPGTWTQSTGTMSTYGSYTYSIQCQGAAGWSNTASVVLTVQDFAMSCVPTTLSLTRGNSGAVNVSSTAYNGFSSTLSLGYSISPAVAVPPTISFSPSNSQAPGSTTSAIITTTGSTTTGTYTLTFSGTGSSTTRYCSSVTLYVYAAPSVTLSADQTDVIGGQYVTLSWTPSNTYSGTQCYAGNAWSGSKNSTPDVTHTGQVMFDVPGVYNVNIYCDGPGGSSPVVGLNITVRDFSLSCSPPSTSIAAGSTTSFSVSIVGYTSFSGTVSYAPSPTRLPAVANPPTVGNLSPATGSPGGSSASSLITTTSNTTTGLHQITYYGSYTNALGTTTRSCTTFLTITAASPTGTITCNGNINSCSIPYNTSATIAWNTSNATNCSVTNSGDATAWSGTSGSQSTGNLTSNRTYTLACTGPGGAMSPNQTVNVIVASDFILSCSPLTDEVVVGSTSSVNISNVALNGFSEQVVLTDNITTIDEGQLVPPIPSVSYSPGNTMSAGGSTTAIINIPANVTPDGYLVTFIATAGTRQHTCEFELYVTSQPPATPVNVEVSNDGACGTIEVSWADNDSGGVIPAGYRVYRRTQGTGTWTDSWTQVGDDQEYRGGTEAIGYSVVDENPLLSNGANYYGVASFSDSGVESAITEPDTTPIFPIPCEPTLSLSDKDLIAVEGRITQSFATAPCSGASDIVTLPNNAVFAPGDLVTFQINICNSGEAAINSIELTDTMSNLTFEEVTDVSPDNCADLTSYKDSEMTFTIDAIAEKGDNAIAESCSITYTAVVNTPTAFGSTIYRFQNLLSFVGYDEFGNNYTGSIYTPPYLFSVTGRQPERAETAPQ